MAPPRSVTCNLCGQAFFKVGSNYDVFPARSRVPVCCWTASDCLEPGKEKPKCLDTFYCCVKRQGFSLTFDA